MHQLTCLYFFDIVDILERNILPCALRCMWPDAGYVLQSTESPSKLTDTDTDSLFGTEKQK